MEALETKVDECLHDTRPMWKALQTQITELQSQIAGLREEMKEGFIKIESRLDALSIEFNKLGGKLLLYDRRLASLESKPS